MEPRDTHYDPALARAGRLAARPGRFEPPGTGGPGLHALGLGEGRDGLLLVPASYRAEQAAPLVLMLHGAGGVGRHGIGMLRDLAEELGVLLLAPDSREGTWDLLVADYGPDVMLLQRALEQTFRRYNVDPARLAVGGFSDGASYALSLGLSNGDLFGHVLAFSPGFMAPRLQAGAPRIYISHGTQDAVLPIDRCSRRIVPQLRRAGYELLYEEFQGPHGVPAAISRQALRWFLGL